MAPCSLFLAIACSRASSALFWASSASLRIRSCSCNTRLRSASCLSFSSCTALSRAASASASMRKRSASASASRRNRSSSAKRASPSSCAASRHLEKILEFFWSQRWRGTNMGVSEDDKWARHLMRRAFFMRLMVFLIFCTLSLRRRLSSLSMALLMF